MIDVKFKKRDIMLSWSGGLDSTLILLKAIEKLDKGELDSLVLVYIDIPILNKIKKEKEKYARMMIIKKLKELAIINKDTDSKIYSTIIYADHLDDSANSDEQYIGYTNKLTAPQPFLWLTNSLAYIDDKYELVYGHLADDSYSQIKDYYSNLLNMMDATNKVMGKNFTLNLPLINYNKIDIVNEYFNNDSYLQLLPILSFCESPDGDKNSCGICECCKKMKSVLYKTGYENNYIQLLHDYDNEPILQQLSLTENEENSNV